MKPVRVRNACMRCRRQKLKCDDIRPCQLCTRAGINCESVASKRQKKKVDLRPLRRKDIRDQSTAREPVQPPPVIPAGVESNAAQSIPIATHGPEDRTPSTFHLVEQLFRNHLTNLRQSDAIPDGHSVSKHPTNEAPKVLVKDLVGIQLPQAPVASILIDAYLEANHWYLALFHEPTFRTRVAPIIQTGHILESDKSFLVLLMVVLMIGMQFVRPETIAVHDALFDPVSYRNTILNAVEQHIFSSLREIDVESISSVLLMSITYLLERKTKLAFVLCGMGLRIAQAIGLHDERTWGPLDNIELQVRRRVWWAIYMADGYTAQAYGKPCVLAGAQFHVSEPQDLDDSLTTCPGISSFEVREDGLLRSVTSFSYNRYKSQLYSIMSAMVQDIRLQQVKEIYSRLLAWEATIPPELRLDNFKNHEGGLQDRDQCTFALQALTLQLTFDHNMLLLFRPFLLSNRHLSIPIWNQSKQGDVEMPFTVQNQLATSAIRTSSIYQCRAIINLVCNTTSAAQVCFQCFTAGVILAMLALANISSPKIPEFKQALARLINILPMAGSGTSLSKQSVEILTDAMHIISSQEVRALIDDAAGGFQSETPRSGNQEGQNIRGDGQVPDSSPNTILEDGDMWEELGMPHDEDGVGINSSVSLYRSLALLF